MLIQKKTILKDLTIHVIKEPSCNCIIEITSMYKFIQETNKNSVPIGFVKFLFSMKFGCDIPCFINYLQVQPKLKIIILYIDRILGKF